jgi:hypothetical protein
LLRHLVKPRATPSSALARCWKGKLGGNICGLVLKERATESGVTKMSTTSSSREGCRRCALSSGGSTSALDGRERFLCSVDNVWSRIINHNCWVKSTELCMASSQLFLRRR